MPDSGAHGHDHCSVQSQLVSVQWLVHGTAAIAADALGDTLGDALGETVGAAVVGETVGDSVGVDGGASGGVENGDEGGASGGSDVPHCQNCTSARYSWKRACESVFVWLLISTCHLDALTGVSKAASTK